MDKTTTVYLDDETAKLFVEFQKRHAFMKLMEEIGAFDIKSGSVEIHFDNIGQIKDVKKHLLYRL